MRRRGVLRAAACAIAAAGAVATWAVPAGAGATFRAAWWSATSPAPAPDVPADGLHVAGGPQGPSAIAAIAVEVPEGATVQVLELELAGVTQRAEGLQACVIDAADAGFEPVQNGSWGERPAYDCDAGAVVPTFDGSTLRFDVAALQRGPLLAVALVPGTTDRASFAEPVPPAVLIPPVTETASPAPVPAPATASTPPTRAPAAFTPSPVSAPPSAPATVAAVPVVAGAELPARPASTEVFVGAAATAHDDGGGQPTRTRVGGALGFGLLLAALLFYSQGRGLLGARIGGF